MKTIKGHVTTVFNVMKIAAHGNWNRIKRLKTEMRSQFFL